MAALTDIFQGLHHLPEGQALPPGADRSARPEPWGFTLYRTAYGPASDAAWQALVDNIGQQVKHDLKYKKMAGEDEAAEQMLSLFRLDARSDAATLANATKDDLRQLHRRDASTRRRPVFLLADEEILGGAAHGDFFVKCVDVDYEAAQHKPKSRFSLGRGQRYFGWMKMTPRSVLELWVHLQTEGLERIAPPTVGGVHLKVWDGDEAW